MDSPPKDFNIDRDSRHLKALCAKHDSEQFIADIATLLTYIDSQGLEVQPFQGLDSPMRQLTYLAALNLTSDPTAIEKTKEITNEEWAEMVKYSISVKAGYFDLLLPKAGDDPTEFQELYRVAMPVFMDYYNTGSLNYEEQTIEHIDTFFSPFDAEIENRFQLKTSDFINIYNLIDEELFNRLNYPMYLTRSDDECRQFWKTQFDTKIHPLDWKYDGPNRKITELVQYMTNRGEKNTVDINVIKKLYHVGKVDQFFELFSISREKSNFVFYTESNPVLSQPIYKRNDGRYLIIAPKELITVVYNKLTQFCINHSSKLADRFYNRRGKILQEKIQSLFHKYFKGNCHIYNEYSIDPHGEGQDLLVVSKGLAFIIEAKAGREAEPMRDVRKSFEKIATSFRNNIQQGYEQAYRIKRLFDNNETFSIYDKGGRFQYKLNTKKYHNYFSIVVTLSKFREPQIDLTRLLDLEDQDDRYPFSVCIDDLEIILLTMIKLKKGAGDLIRFLHFRERLQGRLKCGDELELWGAFINNRDFKIHEDENIHFQTFPEMASFYDDLYKKGIGFANEKNLDRKQSDQYLYFDATDVKKFRAAQINSKG